MVRVKQFADDLGISKNQAQSLINKGRSRKDGGSQILEKVMKPKGYKDGGSKTKTKKKKDKKDNSKAELMPYIKGGRAKKSYGDSQIIPDIRGGRAKPLDKDIDYADLMIKAGRDNSSIKGYLAGGSIASSVKKDSKKIKKTNKKSEDPMGNLFGKDKEIKIRPEAQAPYDPDFNPDQYHQKLNPKGTKGRPEVLPKNKKAKGGLPDLTGDGKVTRADVLKGRGVPGFSRGGGMAIQGLGFKGVK